MNDRYLFKAKGQTDGKWHTGLLAEVREGVCVIYESARFCWICDAETLCQCTGLKDKNGTLIWENDIIDDGSRIWKVHYYNPFAMYMLNGVKHNGGSNGMNIQLADCKVIGNIFDNPELLEVE